MSKTFVVTETVLVTRKIYIASESLEGATETYKNGGEIIHEEDASEIVQDYAIKELESNE